MTSLVLFFLNSSYDKNRLINNVETIAYVTAGSTYTENNCNTSSYASCTQNMDNFVKINTAASIAIKARTTYSDTNAGTSDN